jgi:protein-tyrosine phosphatase
MSLARTSRPALIVALVAFAALPAAAFDVADVHGIPNFHKVGEHLYRGAQPSDAAFSDLAKLGVTTVLDLRQPTEHSTGDEAALVQGAGMRYINVPMKGFVAPSPEQLASVRAVMDTGGVVFVHCKKGKDRTGTVVALYRIERDGWANDKAYAEAKDNGIQWFSGAMKSLIRTYKPTEAVLASAPKANAAVPAVVLSATPDSSQAKATVAGGSQN